MKKRLISVAVGLVLLAAVMIWYDSWFANVVFMLLGALAIFEALRALGFGENGLFIGLYIALHAANMVLKTDEHYLLYLALFVMFCIVMFDKRRYTFKAGAGAFAVFVMITVGLSSILRMRDMVGLYGDQLFMLFIGLALGWICDTFAFTFGNLFGKRKMCEHISPNKTVAGGVGGVLGTMVFIAAAFYLYSTFSNPASVFHGLNSLGAMAFYTAMGAVGAVIGIIGDLAASFIKRECGIKDFGNIMPGHGGALDRLDSVLVTSTFAAFAFQLLFRLFSVG